MLRNRLQIHADALNFFFFFLLSSFYSFSVGCSSVFTASDFRLFIFYCISSDSSSSNACGFINVVVARISVVRILHHIALALTLTLTLSVFSSLSVSVIKGICFSIHTLSLSPVPLVHLICFQEKILKWFFFSLFYFCF